MDTFQALAEPTRRNILELLASSGQLSATEICDNFDVTPPAISQHLKVLRESHLVDVERQAQKRLYQINIDAMDELEEWARKMKITWNARFGVLAEVLVAKKRRVK